MKKYQCTVWFADGEAVTYAGTPAIAVFKALAGREHLSIESNRILKVTGEMGEEYAVNNMYLIDFISPL
jgi:hypothetical protein